MNLSTFKEAMKNSSSMFMKNLKDAYFNLGGDSAKSTFKNAAKTFNNWVTLSDELWKSDFGNKSMMKITDKFFLQKGLSLFNVKEEKDGKISSKEIVLYDFMKIFNYGEKSLDGFKKLTIHNSSFYPEKLSLKIN